MNNLEIKFPEGTKFLVTGCAGFIGSNLVESILEMGHIVIGVDNLSNGNMENINELISQYNNFFFREMDIRNFEDCVDISKDVDYILHQAALGSVPRSVAEPLIYEDNNVKGTSNIFEAAKLNNVKRVVYASSSSVYGDSTTMPKREGEEGSVLSPYALSKCVNEEYAKLYTVLYGVECIGLRYFNVFGKKQSPESAYAALIPKMVKLIMAGESVPIYGDGEQSRDFTYISNVVQANLKACLAEKAATGRAYNIACGKSYTVTEVYKQICKLIGKQVEAVYGDKRKGDVLHSLADISQASEMLKYVPEWSFDKGLKETVKWYLGV